jgi:peptide/nickel transport system ATP-binding protein
VRVALTSLLEVQNLTVEYKLRDGVVTALRSVNLEISKGEFLAVVGESGCGKTTLGLSIIALLPKNASCHGSIKFKGVDLLKLPPDELRMYRGKEIAMIFQEPLTSLNPVYRVGNQVAEAIVLRELRKHGKRAIGEVMQKAYKTSQTTFSRFPAFGRRIPEPLKEEVIKWFQLVRIPDPARIIDRYPFELSGGMRQRVMIAMALCQEPSLLIADEPTTALDVTTQAQVLKIIRELIEKVGTSVLLITHDLAVASQVADRIVVMYAGEVVEDCQVYELFKKPLHPYTQALLSCLPRGTKHDTQLKPIPGMPPDLRKSIQGCAFAPRCSNAFSKCFSKNPRLVNVNGRKVACFLYGDE